MHGSDLDGVRLAWYQWSLQLACVRNLCSDLHGGRVMSDKGKRVVKIGAVSRETQGAPPSADQELDHDCQRPWNH